MKARKKNGKRVDNKGRVLKTGESVRDDGRYYYSKMIRGQRIFLYADSLEELRKKENEALHDLDLGINRTSHKVTLNECFDRWYQQKKELVTRGKMREKTYNNYGFMYNHYVRKSALGKTAIADIRKSDVVSFYNSLGKTLSDNTIDNIQTVLHQVFDYAVEDDMIFRNPSDNAFRKFAGEHRKRDAKVDKALTFEEEMLFRELLNHVRNSEHWKPIFTVFLETGMRCCELCALRWCDVDLEKGVISVNHDLESCNHDGVFSFKVNNDLKTLAGRREIPISKACRDAFESQKKYLTGKGISCKSVIDGYTDFIFLNRYGCVYHEGALNKALKRIIEQLDKDTVKKIKADNDDPVILRLTTHIFRHTLSTRLNDSGVNIKVCQAILGHSDPEITINVYTDATRQKIDEDFGRFTQQREEQQDRWNKNQ